MEREYLRRRNGGPQRRPQLYPGRNQRGRPPWIVWVLLALALIVLVTILIVKLTGDGESTPDEPSSSAVSSAWTPPESEAGLPAMETPEPPQALQEPSMPQSDPQFFDTFMTIDGTGYAYYHFNEEATNDYILALDSAAQALSGTAELYNLVVPSSMDVMLPDSYLSQHNVDSSDQRKALDRYILPSIQAVNPDVHTVPLFVPLRSHCNEYIYFGSDRMWTQLGAYYAYVEFCKAKGFEPASLDSFNKDEYGGFLGGLSAESDEAILDSDKVTAYHPNGNASLRYFDEDGDAVDWPVIHDGDDYDSSLLYLIFAAGDHAYKELINDDLSDNSACVVVQDSLGNYFIPFLTQHYQHIYVVDYRDYDGNVKDLAKDNGAADVIILNSISATSSSTAVESIKSLF